MTSAATGHAIQGRNKGWRKAVRYALTENPVTDSPHEPPAVFELRSQEGPAARPAEKKGAVGRRRKSARSNEAEQ